MPGAIVIASSTTGLSTDLKHAIEGTAMELRHEQPHAQASSASSLSWNRTVVSFPPALVSKDSQKLCRTRTTGRSVKIRWTAAKVAPLARIWVTSPQSKVLEQKFNLKKRETNPKNTHQVLEAIGGDAHVAACIFHIMNNHKCASSALPTCEKLSTKTQVVNPQPAHLSQPPTANSCRVFLGWPRPSQPQRKAPAAAPTRGSRLPSPVGAQGSNWILCPSSGA